MKYVIQEPSRIIDRIFPMKNYKKKLTLACFNGEHVLDVGERGVAVNHEDVLVGRTGGEDAQLLVVYIITDTCSTDSVDHYGRYKSGKTLLSG